MRGTIEKLPSGSFRISIYLGKDPATGKMIRARNTVDVPTKKDADREPNKMLREMDTGAYVEPARDTVREYLERSLKDDVTPTRDTPSTRRCDAVTSRCHPIPTPGQLKLAIGEPSPIQEGRRTVTIVGQTSRNLKSPVGR